MTTAHIDLVIQQGATFEPSWHKHTCAYTTKYVQGYLVNAVTGRPVPDSDLQPVDYSGCTALMQLRVDVLDQAVLLEFSTDPTAEQGDITLSAEGKVALELSAAQTAALPYGDGPGQWTRAVGQMEVTYPNGTVLREYEIHFCLSPEGTRHA